ncbi:hypothetical protein DCAR_0208260 [Daucus carota subsp. sativus]|uniref:pectinesterase n=1 Tax=Daucus carota subsp. sativus TaxID=79200 RepID=A0A166EF61_DAUCS|nr:PREDICTED: 21 kDa protein-like [Daucus carota subsp. sativus]WOG89024.1 hypothetical protein DCAR_0208260 [Daucus carota subsp. sativus]
MDTQLSLAILSLLSILLNFHHISAETPPDAAPSVSPANNSEFIRTNCQTTLYPELCYRSLSRHALKIQEDPALLARAAIGVSLNRAKRMANYVSNLTQEADTGANEPRAVSALHDCFSVFGDAVEQIRDSLRQMLVMNGSGESLRFQMSNVQTYMSAALTNEDTCTDGFEEVSDGPMKKDVCDRTVKVTQVTSNALALVNSYVSKVTNP